MFSKKFKMKKFNKLINKALEYLNHHEFYPQLTEKEKMEFLNQIPAISNLISNIKHNLIEEQEEKKHSCECIKAMASLDYTDNIIREFKQSWKREHVLDLLLKTFDAYDFKKLKYDLEKKEIIARQYSIKPERLTDQVNLFVNDCIKGEEKPYSYDKYGIVSENLLTIQELLRWKYRDLIKPENKQNFNYSSVSERYRKILEKLF